MIIVPTIQPRRKRAPAPVAATPPGAPLILQAATYLPDEFQLQLVFDRAIDVSGLNASAITVRDGTSNYRIMIGYGPGTQPIAEQVVADLMEGAEYTGGDVLLFATAGSGIKAVDDGGTWEGASGVELPYG